jgi:DNA-binding transcriptional ArsR family regulator
MPTDPDPRLPAAPAVRLFGLLSNETRLRLLLALADGDGDTPVGGLAEALGVSQSALSQHLRRLRQAGAITWRREGHNIFYALAPGPARDILLRHVRP